VKNLKKSVLWTRKGLVPTLFALILSTVIVSVGMALAIPVVTQASSTPTVFIDPPTINGTVIDQEFTVNVMITGAKDMFGWMAGMTFNPTFLSCIGFFEGDFLKNKGSTSWTPANISNTTGVIAFHGCVFTEDAKVDGDGQLAYATFKVKEAGVSDLHLIDVALVDYYEPIKRVRVNIIDVYTVTEVTPPQTVVTVSNSTIREEAEAPNSGLSDHAFNASAEEISFKVYGPYPGFCNVTIPKALLNATTLDGWKVIIDSILVSRTPTENLTHTSIYFTYAAGLHEVAISTRAIESSTISIIVSPTSVQVGENVTISGDIDPVRQNVNVTILYKPSGGTWTTMGINQTDSNSRYSYTWTTTKGGTYEIKASWNGDSNTEGAESIVQTLKVKGAAAAIDPYIVAAAVVVIIIIAAIVVYYLRVRKVEEE